MLALAVVLIVAAFVVVACEERAEAPVQVPGTSVDIDVDRSKPRPKMTTPPQVRQPVKVAPPKQSTGRRR